MNTKSLSQAEAKKHFHYDPNTGLLVWKTRPSNRVNIGDGCGGVDPSGYLICTYKSRRYRVHQIIWLIVHGKWPDNDTDHKNHNRSDNRLTNLREATRQENMQNSTTRTDNTSGVMGVSWTIRDVKWRAYITFNQKRIGLGYHSDWFDAVCARKAAENKYGFHPNHGR